MKKHDEIRETIGMMPKDETVVQVMTGDKSNNYAEHVGSPYSPSDDEEEGYSYGKM